MRTSFNMLRLKRNSVGPKQRVGVVRNEPFDARCWRGRSEEALALAMQLDDRDARLMLLDMAGTYDRLAQRAQRDTAIPKIQNEKLHAERFIVR
jgi:hypothetical protein